MPDVVYYIPLIVAACFVFLAGFELWKSVTRKAIAERHDLQVTAVSLILAGAVIALQGTGGFYRLLFRSGELVSQREINVSVRDFLTSGDYEPSGFGLYSYMLFGNRGDTNRKERLSALSGYLNQFDAFRTTKVRSRREEINAFYVPTIQDAEWIDQCIPAPYAPPDPAVSGSKPKPRWSCTFEKKTRDWDVGELAEWIDRQYDYQRTDELLHLLQHVVPSFATSEGIYVVSYTSPLLGKTAPNPSVDKLLIQSLSRVPPDFIETWIEELRIQFGKPQYWDVNTLRWTILNIRTRLPAIADKLDFIGTAIGEENKSTSPTTKKDTPSQKK